MELEQRDNGLLVLMGKKQVAPKRVYLPLEIQQDEKRKIIHKHFQEMLDTIQQNLVTPYTITIARKKLLMSVAEQLLGEDCDFYELT
jgi:hypothetical protein